MVIFSIPRQLVNLIGSIGIDSTDSNEQRLQRTLLVGIALMIALAGALWGVIYIALGEFLAGSIPLSYSLFSFLSIAVFARTHRYHFFRLSQLLLILLLPFLLMVSLGGFVNSSAVILWSLLCPLGALLFLDLRRAKWWFLAYLALVIISGLLQPYVRVSNNLTPDIVLIFFVMNISAISAIAFVLLHYFVSQKNRFLHLLNIEQKKSDRLLLNVLPKEIAAILKTDDSTIAHQFDEVSILFADIVGFTTLSVKMAPDEVVELLNDVFSYFDSLVDKYGLEKIRTIGDSYMVVGGAPRPCPDHAQAMARLALEMRAYVEEYRRNGRRLSFRIGIASGPVVGGVIGRQKFHYDVWGDAVNMASRMESQGVPGKIQITGDTHELLKDAYICLPRGKVSVKGKGEMATWFLDGIKTSA